MGLMIPDFSELASWISLLTRREIPNYFTRAYHKEFDLAVPQSVLKIRPQDDYFFSPLFIMASWTPGAAFAGAFNLEISDNADNLALESRSNRNNIIPGIDLMMLGTPGPGGVMRYFVDVQHLIAGKAFGLFKITGYTPGQLDIPPDLKFTVWGINFPVTEDTRQNISMVANA